MTSLKDKFIPGAKVGAYELVRRLGAGGMGTVFEARGPSGRVAVKVLTAYPVESGRDPRFQREAEALRLLSHPGIVPVLDAGTDRATGTPYLVMELLEGDDLDSMLLRTGRFSPEIVIAIGLEIGAALEHAHLHAFVHRDIKPANVFLPRDIARGRAILCDFGLSKRTDLAASLTETGALLGTPHYMSPEQFLDAKRVDAKSDVFGLSMTLLHALVGIHPYEHLTDPSQLMLQLCTKPVPDARELLPSVPPALAEALARGLVTDPRRRASVAELVAALEVARTDAGEPVRSRTKPPSTVAGSSRRGSVARAPKAPKTLDLEQGTYRVLTRDASTGLAYEGLDVDGRVVQIVKIPGIFRTDEGRAAFSEEVTALCSVLSESLVAVLDHGAVGDDAWLVTEPRDGQDLQSFVDEAGPWSYAPALRAFSRAARGLSALAEAGVVHGSLRPEAFHVRAGARGTKLLVLHDLGVSRRLASFTTKSGASSPPGRRNADIRTDVVGVLATLSYALTGRLPFAGRSKGSIRADALAKVGGGAKEKAALEALLQRAMTGKIPSLVALATELRLLGGEGTAY